MTDTDRRREPPTTTVVVRIPSMAEHRRWVDERMKARGCRR